jgi:hypothetical protein
MSLSKSKCWYKNNCLHFLEQAVPFVSFSGQDSMERLKEFDKNSYEAMKSLTAKNFPSEAVSLWKFTQHLNMGFLFPVSPGMVLIN